MGTCVADLSSGLGIAPSTVSHHLKELRQSGLITMGRQGRRVERTVNLEAAAELRRLLGVEELDLNETTG